MESTKTIKCKPKAIKISGRKETENIKTNKDSKNNKWAQKKNTPKSGKSWTEKVNATTYNLFKWHNVWVIHDRNATSDPTAGKLCLAEEASDG